MRAATLRAATVALAGLCVLSASRGSAQPGVAALSDVACVGGFAEQFRCRNIRLLSWVPIEVFDTDVASDIWGWTDPATGVDYAILGLEDGVGFVELADPTQPIYLGRLPTHASGSDWADIKVFQDHAFIVKDSAGDHGLQVFDLTQLRGLSSSGSLPLVFTETAHYGGFSYAHNFAINEDTGFGYAVDSDCTLHAVDLSNPTDPVFVGCFDDDAHDSQCVTYSGPDPDHVSSEICFNSSYAGLTIVDATDKSAFVEVSATGYPTSGFPHQGWLSEDHRYFLLNDEDEYGTGARIHVFDVGDLDSPTYVGPYEHGLASIAHNLYVKGNRVYHSTYTSGVRIVTLGDPGALQLSEEAYLDTYPEDDSEEFAGSWSNYPFFDSGIVIVSDIERGLFVLWLELSPAAGLALPGKKLKLKNTVPDLPAKNRVTWVVADPSVAGIEAGGPDDPRCLGASAGTVKATLRFWSEASSHDTGEIALPCENWRAFGATPLRNYQYKDKKQEQGPCRLVRLKEGKQIVVNCRGEGFLYDLEPGIPEGTVDVNLTVGAQRYCSSYGAYKGRDGSDGRTFRGRDSPAPASCPGVTAPAVPDECGDALQIGSLPFSINQDARFATIALDDPSFSCGAGGHSVWYRFAATNTGNVTVDTLGSSYNTVLAAHSGTCGAFTEIACNDDTSDLQSEVTFAATAGATYYLEVTSYDTEPAGFLTLNVAEAP